MFILVQTVYNPWMSEYLSLTSQVIAKLDTFADASLLLNKVKHIESILPTDNIAARINFKIINLDSVHTGQAIKKYGFDLTKLKNEKSQKLQEKNIEKINEMNELRAEQANEIAKQATHKKIEINTILDKIKVAANLGQTRIIHQTTPESLEYIEPFLKDLGYKVERSNNYPTIKIEIAIDWYGK